MSGLASADLRGFLARLDLTEARQKQRVTDTYRTIVEAIFTDIVKHTPQFTGNLVYGWEIVMVSHPPVAKDRYNAGSRARFLHNVKANGMSPFQRGDSPAVKEVLARELPKLADLRWNSIVKIYNNTSYAEDVDHGNGPDGRPIRPENLYYGTVFMTTRAALKYNRMRNLVKVVS